MLKALLIAKTEIQPAAIDILDWSDPMMDSDGEYLAEFSGRACYQSWSRPNPLTASAKEYVKRNILAKGHTSVLEHATVSFYVTGISRSAGYELLRHRHLSRSELSQRYVDMSDTRFVKPPLITDMERKLVEGFELEMSEDYFQGSDHFEDIRHAYEDLNDVIDIGVEGGYREVSNKERREVQRSALPNSTETKFVVTGNLRAWRHVVKMRGALDADAEIRQFAIEVFRQLSEDSPAVWDDMELATDEHGREFVRSKP